jgi:hypothetical protein
VISASASTAMIGVESDLPSRIVEIRLVRVRGSEPRQRAPNQAVLSCGVTSQPN